MPALGRGFGPASSLTLASSLRQPGARVLAVPAAEVRALDLVERHRRDGAVEALPGPAFAPTAPCRPPRAPIATCGFGGPQDDDRLGALDPLLDDLGISAVRGQLVVAPDLDIPPRAARPRSAPRAARRSGRRRRRCGTCDVYLSGAEQQLAATIRRLSDRSSFGPAKSCCRETRRVEACSRMISSFGAR